MQVIPVIDLLGGQVVRGIAGRREEYRPIQSQIAADARPITVAQALVEQFGFGTVYVADLDAIMHRRPDVRAWSEIAGAGLKLWLDAGVGNCKFAWHILNQIALAEISARLVVGLESLESQDEFEGIVEMFAMEPPIFSLDLREGQPLVRNPAWQGLSALEIALLASSLGVSETIVLDLADVGTSGGTRTLELCREIATGLARQNLIAGGGVRGFDDLAALAAAGCTHALVASALHDGRLTREDVRRAELLVQ
jgi:phosphoribosylformimino-5-aminoimidazole carboxamide ribotide isomerase